MSLAGDERAAICDEFDKVGPDHATLCEGWTTRELLVHLLVRERQPWAVPGIVVPALAPIAERASRSWADTSWSEMVDLLRAGAPPWSPFRLGKVDELGNGAELFVHHEDVRRGEPAWEPRPADITRDAQLWTILLRMGRVLYRGAQVGIVVRRPSGEQHVVKTGPGVATIIGEPGEIVLHAFGRDAAHVVIDGTPADVAALKSGSRGI